MPKQPDEATLTEVVRQLIARSIPTSTADGRHRYELTDLPRSDAFRCQLRISAASVPAKRAEDAEQEGNDEGSEQPGMKTIGHVRGVASSTSVDWYGTEMSKDALDDMAVQLASDSGVPLLPTHGSWISGLPDWDQVIGESVEAEVRRGTVADPYDDAEAGYVLEVFFALLDCVKAHELSGRLDNGQRIGLSIGGWFRAVAVIYNEETDEVERIIVHAVTLDHVAVTRMPANPDSTGLANMRARMLRAVQMVRSDIAGQLPEITNAVPDGESPAGNQRAVSDKIQPEHALDSAVSTGEDHSEEPAVRAPDNSQEIDMTPEQIAELVERAIKNSLESTLPGAVNGAVGRAIEQHVDPLRAEVAELRAKVESRTPDAVVEPGGRVSDDDADALRAQVEELTRTVQVLANQPARRGIHADGRVISVPGGIGAEATMRAMVGECRAERSGMALAAVMDRHVDVLAEEEGPRFDGRGSKRSLVNLLTAGLRAAEADGLINRPQGGAWN